MTKKKVLSILLIICMLMSLMPTFAFADEDGQTGTTGTTEVIGQSNDADDKGTTESKEQNLDENNTSGAPAGDSEGTEEKNEEEAALSEGTQTEGEPAVKVAKIGNTEYESLAVAIAAALSGDSTEGVTITLQSDATLEATVYVNAAKNITIDGQGHKIIAADNFATASNASKDHAVFSISAGSLTLKDVKVDANKKCRVIYASGGTLTLDKANITGGRVSNNFIAGVYMTSKAKFIMKDGSTITGNTIDGTYAGDNYLQYSADLWIGANAEGTIEETMASIEGGVVDNVFVNANKYSENHPGSFTLNGGTVKNLYVEYDDNFGGAFTYTDGDLQNLYVSTTTNKKSVKVTPVKGTEYHGGVVAQIGDKLYTSLSDAVDKASIGDTVVVLDNMALAETQAIAKDITLDLNGCTIAGANNVIAITDGASVTIQDSKASQPTVDGSYQVSYSGGEIHHTGGRTTGSAIAVIKGTATILSGSLVSDKNIALAVHGNSAYDNSTPIVSRAIVQGGYLLGTEGAAVALGNGATLDIEDGVLVATDNAVVAGNGTCSQKDGKNYGGTVINISGGTMIGHITPASANSNYIACGVYHPQAGVLTISGGTIYAIDGVGVLMRNGELNVQDEAVIMGSGIRKGKVGDSTVIEAGYGIEIDYQTGYNHNNTPTDTRKVSITGGSISADNGADAVYVRTESGNKSVAQFVEGGRFSSDPFDYLKAGYVAKAITKDPYKFEVVEQTASEAIVKPAEPNVAFPDGLDDTTKAKLTTALTASQVEGEGLAEAAGTAAEKSNVTPEQGAEALTEAGIDTDDAAVTIVIQPYMEIGVQKYDETTKTLILDITPMYQIVATTANLNATDSEIILSGDNVTDANAVKIGEAKELNIQKTVDLTVKVPDGFLASVDVNQVFVKHLSSKGTRYYKATVNARDNTLTFTNENGFSVFEVQTDARKAKVAFKISDTITNEKDITLADVNQALPTASKTGYTFDGWNFDGVTGGPYLTLTDDLLTKLAALTGTIKATPVFHSNSSGGSSGGGGGGGSATVNYTITATAGEGGKISPSDKVSVTSGSNKTFTITANAGYMISDVLVDGESVGAVSTYTFEKVTKAHTIKAEFTKTDNTGLPFTDVSGSDWFYAPVKYVYDQKLMVGVADDQFGPYTQTTRGMIVTMLWRMAGEPQAQTAADFTDVAAGDWYAKAIDWAAEKGIVNGYGNGAFGPNDPITREQLAAIFCNYAKANGKNVSARADLSAYSDQPSQWAESAMQWAVAQKLISGKGNGVLDPTGQATRAEAAAILMRYVTTFGK